MFSLIDMTNRLLVQFMGVKLTPFEEKLITESDVTHTMVVFKHLWCDPLKWFGLTFLIALVGDVSLTSLLFVVFTSTYAGLANQKLYGVRWSNWVQLNVKEDDPPRLPAIREIAETVPDLVERESSQQIGGPHRPPNLAPVELLNNNNNNNSPPRERVIVVPEKDKETLRREKKELEDYLKGEALRNQAVTDRLLTLMNSRLEKLASKRDKRGRKTQNDGSHKHDNLSPSTRQRLTINDLDDSSRSTISSTPITKAVSYDEVATWKEEWAKRTGASSLPKKRTESSKLNVRTVRNANSNSPHRLVIRRSGSRKQRHWPPDNSGPGKFDSNDPVARLPQERSTTPPYKEFVVDGAIVTPDHVRSLKKSFGKSYSASLPEEQAAAVRLWRIKSQRRTVGRGSSESYEKFLKFIGFDNDTYHWVRKNHRAFKMTDYTDDNGDEAFPNFKQWQKYNFDRKTDPEDVGILLHWNPRLLSANNFNNRSLIDARKRQDHGLNSFKRSYPNG